METKILSAKDVNEAAEILKMGGIVAIPTETVYGLAADAFNEDAIRKIFIAKGRPSDNPLIVHISSIDEIYGLVQEVTPEAIKLANAFWPGPLTIILKKSKFILDIISGGLDTVAIRMPAHRIAKKIIKKTKTPLVAPSANLSGRPSPTKVEHVALDLKGKIDAIVDAGTCNIGVESTVISLCEKIPTVFRPGAITIEQLESVLGKVEFDSAVINRLDENSKPISPGLKYKHYAPNVKLIILDGNQKQYLDYINNNEANKVAALCFEEDAKNLKIPFATYGKEVDPLLQAKKLFDALRKLDNMKNIDLVYARCPAKSGVGLAVYNRLIRAAGFNIINL